MRLLDTDTPLSVAHLVDDDRKVTPAQPDPVGIRTGKVKKGTTTRCGLPVGPTWIDAAWYQVPDCADCSPAPLVGVEEPMLL